MSEIFAIADAKTLQTLALGLSGASLVLAVVMMLVIKNIVGKIISLVLFLAIAAGGYTQRASITDCADKVKAQATESAINTTCTFFGQDIKIKVTNPAK
jgi:hypothetical protein